MNKDATGSKASISDVSSPLGQGTDMDRKANTSVELQTAFNCLLSEGKTTDQVLTAWRDLSAEQILEKYGPSRSR